MGSFHLKLNLIKQYKSKNSVRQQMLWIHCLPVRINAGTLLSPSVPQFPYILMSDSNYLKGCGKDKIHYPL